MWNVLEWRLLFWCNVVGCSVIYILLIAWRAHHPCLVKITLNLCACVSFIPDWKQLVRCRKQIENPCVATFVQPLYIQMPLRTFCFDPTKHACPCRKHFPDPDPNFRFAIPIMFPVRLCSSVCILFSPPVSWGLLDFRRGMKRFPHHLLLLLVNSTPQIAVGTPGINSKGPTPPRCAVVALTEGHVHSMHSAPCQTRSTAWGEETARTRSRWAPPDPTANIPSTATGADLEGLSGEDPVHMSVVDLEGLSLSICTCGVLSEFWFEYDEKPNLVGMWTGMHTAKDNNDIFWSKEPVARGI